MRLPSGEMRGSPTNCQSYSESGPKAGVCARAPAAATSSARANGAHNEDAYSETGLGMAASWLLQFGSRFSVSYKHVLDYVARPAVPRAQPALRPARAGDPGASRGDHRRVAGARRRDGG